MGGIAGTLDLADGLAPAAPLVVEMLSTLVHRGSDGELLTANGAATLGARTHALLDGADPPVASGPLRLVLDGDVVNVPEVAAALGVTASSQAEAVLAAWAARGPGCLDLLEGGFAFAVWDERDQRLTCARDRFGLKPLYWTVAGGRFRFASELKALLADETVPRVPDDDRVSQYLAYGIADHGAGTLLRGIHHVPASHTLSVTRAGGVESPRRWYTLDPSHADEPPAERTRALLEQSVALRARDPGVLGVTLSGGIDSGSVLALAARHRRELGLDPPLAVVARTADPRVDEWRYAELLLRRYGIDAVQVRPNEQGLVEDFDAFAASLDEPCHSASVYGHWRTMRAVRDAGIDIVLEGQMGERFCGVGEWYPQLFFDMLARGRVGAATRELLARRRVQGIPVRRSLVDLAKLAAPTALRAAHSKGPAWLSLDAAASATRLYAPRRYLALQLHVLAVDDVPLYSREIDRDASAFSLVERAPFTDTRVVEYALSLPPETLHRDGWGKAPVRDAMRGLVPDEILDRRTKQGFTVDATAWVRGAFGDEVARTLRSEAAASRPYWDAAAVARLVDDARAGRASGSEVWRAYEVERWLERVVDSAPSARGASPLSARS